MIVGIDRRSFRHYCCGLHRNYWHISTTELGRLGVDGNRTYVILNTKGVLYITRMFLDRANRHLFFFSSPIATQSNGCQHNSR